MPPLANGRYTMKDFERDVCRLCGCNEFSGHRGKAMLMPPEAEP